MKKSIRVKRSDFFRRPLKRKGQAAIERQRRIAEFKRTGLFIEFDKGH